MSIGDNTWDKLGYVDEEQKGIYRGEEQVGKVERECRGKVLNLLHISAKERGMGLVDKVYAHDVEYAFRNGCEVRSELVNDYTVRKFGEYFGDWDIIERGDEVIARRPIVNK